MRKGARTKRRKKEADGDVEDASAPDPVKYHRDARAVSEKSIRHYHRDDIVGKRKYTPDEFIMGDFHELAQNTLDQAFFPKVIMPAFEAKMKQRKQAVDTDNARG